MECPFGSPEISASNEGKGNLSPGNRLKEIHENVTWLISVQNGVWIGRYVKMVSYIILHMSVETQNFNQVHYIHFQMEDSNVSCRFRA